MKSLKSFELKLPKTKGKVLKLKVQQTFQTSLLRFSHPSGKDMKYWYICFLCKTKNIASAVR